METKATLRWAIAAALWAIAAAPATAAMQGAAPSAMADFTSALPAPARSALFLPSGEQLAVVSPAGRTVSIVTSAGRELLRSVPLPFGPVDTAISADGTQIYLVGPGEAAKTMLARMDVADGTMRSISFDDAGEIIGISQLDNDIYLADRSASGIVGVPRDLFEKAVPNEPLAMALKDVARGSLSFKSGIADIAATDKPGLVFVLHEYENAASVVYLTRERVIDQLSLATQSLALSPLTQALSARSGASKSPEVVTSAVFGDSGGNRIVVSDLDLGFSSLEIVQAIDLAMEYPERSNNPDRQLLVAADREQNVILVGATTSRRVVMFKRVDRTVERVGAADLPGEPVDLAVSSDGRALAFLVNGGNELIVIDRPEVWQELFADRQGALVSIVRDIQRMLSMLGYPVGVVDGMAGLRTKGAIKLFQESVGLPATGEPSAAVQEALREAVPQGNNFEFKQAPVQMQMRR